MLVLSVKKLHLAIFFGNIVKIGPMFVKIVEKGGTIEMEKNAGLTHIIRYDYFIYRPSTPR
jgi:hypothetical protein